MLKTSACCLYATVTFSRRYPHGESNIAVLCIIMQTNQYKNRDLFIKTTVFNAQYGRRRVYVTAPLLARIVIPKSANTANGQLCFKNSK